MITIGQKMIIKTGIALLLSTGLGSVATAQSTAETIFYFGGGVNNDGATVETDETPFVLGILAAPAGSPLLFGLDIAAEGEMLDSTFGSDTIRQSFSFNGLVGTNLYQSQSVRTDASLIVGLRESFADCPDSFLGYQCYADEAPDTEYEFSYGALVTVSFDSVTIGVRATEVSTQAIVGFSF